MGDPIKEQRMADDHLDSLGAIRLDDEEGRFRALAGQQLLGIRRDEHCQIAWNPDPLLECAPGGGQIER